jgi:hypothetical protein
VILSQLAQSSPARPHARPRRMTGGSHLSATTRVCARALALPLPGGGRSVDAGFLRPRSLSRWPDPSTLRTVPSTRSLPLAAPWSPQTTVDHRARTPKTPTTSPAHAPQLPFEHRPEVRNSLLSTVPELATTTSSREDVGLWCLAGASGLRRIWP